MLLNAVGQTDLSTVEKICHEGCDVHFSTTMFPPLIIAANRGSLQMIDLLLEYDANPNVSTAVMGEEEIQCVSCGMILKESNQNCTKCKEVVPRNESTKYADHAGITALHAAVQKAGFLEIVRLLLARGAIVNARTRKGNTPLLYAAAGGHTTCCEEMLRANADPNMECTEDGDTPLHKAIRGSHYDTAKLLIRYNAKLDHRNKQGETPKDVAASYKERFIDLFVDIPSPNVLEGN
mmetsp:Transcript_50818/g.158790  ORF Transcript_50818/g.158790 Transcript_50818/m.158790 type:complete len:236 (-) Transcript_50818:1332-2039(-)